MIKAWAWRYAGFLQPAQVVSASAPQSVLEAPLALPRYHDALPLRVRVRNCMAYLS